MIGIVVVISVPIAAANSLTRPVRVERDRYSLTLVSLLPALRHSFPILLCVTPLRRQRVNKASVID